MEPEVVNQLVKFYKRTLSLKKVLEVLGVSRTTYNRRLKKVPSNRENAKLVKHIKALCEENKFRYGYRKITYLINKTMKANKNTVQKIMQKYDLNCKVRPKRRRSTGKPLNIVENILDFNATSPFEKSMLYLSSIMD